MNSYPIILKLYVTIISLSAIENVHTISMTESREGKRKPNGIQCENIIIDGESEIHGVLILDKEIRKEIDDGEWKKIPILRNGIKKLIE